MTEYSDLYKNQFLTLHCLLSNRHIISTNNATRKHTRYKALRKKILHKHGRYWKKVIAFATCKRSNQTLCIAHIHQLSQLKRNH